MLVRLALEFILFVLAARALTALTLWGVARWGSPRAQLPTPAHGRDVKPSFGAYKRAATLQRSI